MDLHLQDLDFWAGLHGQVPGLLDWDMGNEPFQTFTTVHLPPAEQKLAKYKLRIVEPPVLPLDKKYEADEDDPDIEPNLWMWVNPNIVYPPGKMQVKEAKWARPSSPPLASQRSVKKEEDSCSEATEEQLQQPSSSLGSPCEKPKRSQAAAPPPCPWELAEEEAAQHQDDSSSVALASAHLRGPLQSRRLRQPISSEGRLWPRPPLNYFHLIALALRNSPPCGLNVQQIYSFTRQHFPFFQTAPEGWKNTVRHNLCFRDSFEKVPVNMNMEAGTRPRSCLWKLTEEGHRRFVEEARVLASTRMERIQQCMDQPDMMPFLFDL
ncbi:forkhead box protein R1-like [Dipodomys merriami]|uniref:forkhead box protein R1-like n=2 Tax=Dipodomys merriami TaxID=94247 RepID=UPI0038560894